MRKFSFKQRFMAGVVVLIFSMILLPFSIFAETDKSSEESSSPESKATAKMTFVLDWVPNTNHTGLYVANKLGYFAEEGIEMDIVQPSEESSATLVAMGRGDFGISFQPNMVKRIVKDIPVTAVAAICQHNTSGILSLKSSGIDSLKDLEGKKYSTWEDPIDDAVVRSLLEEKGGDWSKVSLVPGEATDAIAALKLKQFDAIMVYYGWDGIHAEQEGADVNFTYLKDSNDTFDYYAPVIIANNVLLSEREDLAIKALRAISRGYKYAAEHPEEAAEILIEASPETDPDLVKASQKYLSEQYLDENGNFGLIDSARWNKFYSWVNENKDAEGEALASREIKENEGFSNKYMELVNSEK